MSDTESYQYRSSGTGLVIALSLILFYLPPILFILEDSAMHRGPQSMGLIMATFYTASFFINYFWLVPAMLQRSDKRSRYILINALLIIVAMSFIPVWNELRGDLHPHPPREPKIEHTYIAHMLGYIRFILRDGIMMLLAAGLAYAIRLGQEKSLLQKRRLSLDAERKQIELRSLKAQLNPHFLFNSLNNIYALIAFAPEKAQEALHDLSSMLRFMIYDASASTVPLAKELKFINDYVELMRLRVPEGCCLKFFTIQNPAPTLHIPPLLYLTLVENTFKHSAPNKEGKHFIDISIFTTPTELVCCTENSISSITDRTDQQTATGQGVGLENIRRQLNLLYPGEAMLDVSASKDSYKAEIRIALDALESKTSEQ